MRTTSNARQVEIPAARVFCCCMDIDLSGMSAYCVLVWGPDDPARSARPKGGVADKTPHQTNKKTSRAAWALRIEALMEDGVERTFNRMCIEMIDQEASLAHGGPIEEALWMLVAQGRLEHTMEVPVYFRHAEADCG